MKKKKKMVVFSFISIIGLLILLDFIPVKFAVKLNSVDITKYKHLDGQKIYICKPVQVTGSIWEAIGDEKGVREISKNEVIYIAEPLKGNDPFKKLNGSFQKIYESNAYNQFVFVGNEISANIVGDIEIDGVQEKTIDFEVDNWQIVYPIKRDSLRDIYASKAYLTLYDFIKFP